MTNTIKTPAKDTIQIGPIFHPWEESAKNRINPAPDAGIGASDDRLLLLLVAFRFAILRLYIQKIILILSFEMNLFQQILELSSFNSANYYRSVKLLVTRLKSC